MPVKGTYLAMAGGGAILLYSGLRGKNFSDAFRQVLSGKSPSGAQAANAIQVASAPSASGGVGATGPASMFYSGNNSIANDAMQYQGWVYKWGGSPGNIKGSLAGGTDCSGFVNAVIGRDLGMPVPGSSRYDGSSHGPTTFLWWASPLCKTVSQPQAQPGDLVVWWTHMGIYLGNNTMISELSTNTGCVVTTVESAQPTGESATLRFRHYAG